jgi:hypothetical protein
MAENVVLQLILDGISALETKEDLDAVRDAVKDRREKLRSVDEEVDALARGNSDEMIRVNKERYDYSKVPKKDLLMAERWYMAPRPSSKTRYAYNRWRVWNAAKTIEGKDLKGYKGNLIIEKATGRSTEGEQEDIEFDEGEDEEVGEDDEEVREATEAMAGVRVE